MKVELGEVLARAWQITWKNKVLWAISVLPVLVSFLIFPVWLFIVFTGDFDPERMPNWMFNGLENQGLMNLLFLFYLIVFVVSLVLQIISRSSSTLGIYRAEAGIQPITFMDLISDGFPYTLRILGVSLVVAAVYIGAVLVFFACTFVASVATMGLASICLQPLFLLLLPLILLLMAFMEQAEAAVVVDDMKLMDAVKRSYDLIRGNLLALTLIMIVVYVGMMILMSLITFPIMIPMFFFMMQNLESGSPDLTNFFRIQAVFMTVLIPIMALFQGVMLTYLKSAMMVVYLRLTRSSGSPQPILQEVITP